MSRSLAVTCLLAGALLCIAGEASAGPDIGSADQLFAQAKQLMSEGKFAQACAKFEASYDADPALGALLNLADCLERDGRMASAYGRWGDAIDYANKKNDERAKFARERREEIKPKLSFVTLAVKGEADDLTVFKGDTKLSKGAFGTALPTDPGETVIQVVRGADQVLWETTIVLAEAQQKTVEIPLDVIAQANPTTMKKRSSGSGRTGPRGDVGAAPEGFWSTQRIAGFVVGAGGLLVAGGGFALGGIAQSKKSDLDAECSAGEETRYCTPSGLEIADEARTFAEASTYTLIAGGIVVAVGITVIITAPNEYAKLEDRAYILPWFSPDGGGAMIGGRF
jgi:tetratricopeptide (TPR) repeat protein